MAGTCWGQWSSNWPAYQHPRAGKYHANECYSTTVERCQSTGVTLPSSPSFFRSQRSNIIDDKSKLKAAAVLFFNNAYVTNSSVLPRLNSATNSYTGKTSGNNYALSNLYAICKLPTNFFDYTPYRGLDGVGPFTNDAAVGHPHGWTNSETQVGGDNYPSGRSMWYTTDYGWDGVVCIATNLRYTYKNNSFYSSAALGYSSDPSFYDEPTWAGAQSRVENTFTNTVVRGHYTFAQYDTNIGYEASAASKMITDARAGSFCSTSIVPSAVEVVFVTSTPDWADSTNGITPNFVPVNTYDASLYGYTNMGSWFTGLSVSEPYGWQSAIATTNQSYNDGSGVRKWQWYTENIGGTNFPPWCVDPVSPIAGRRSRGYNVTDYGGIFLDFVGTTNGFKFK